MADQRFDVSISTQVELAAFKQFEAELVKQAARLRAVGQEGSQAYKDIETQLASVRGRLSETGMSWETAQGSPAKLGESGSALTSMAGKAAVAAAAVAALKAAWDLAGESLAEFAQTQELVTGLDAALASQGKLTDDYRVKLQDLANQLEKTTAIADDDWFAVLTKLTQFGADETNIDQYATAVKNLGALMGGNVVGAADAFSKALVGNFTQLQRVGIRTDANATQVDRLNSAMEQLAQRGGGQLEARAGTLAGKQRSLGLAFDNVKSAIGGAIASTTLFKHIMESAETGMNNLAKALDGTVPKIAGLQNAAEPAGAAVDEFSDSVDTTAASATAANPLLKALEDRISGIESRARAAAAAMEALKQDADDVATLEKQRAENKKDVGLAQVDAQLDKGSITQLEAVQKRADLERNYRKEVLAIDDRAAEKKGAANLAGAEAARKSALDAKAALDDMVKQGAPKAEIDKQQQTVQRLNQEQSAAQDKASTENAKLTRDRALAKEKFQGQDTVANIRTERETTKLRQDQDVKDAMNRTPFGPAAPPPPPRIKPGRGAMDMGEDDTIDAFAGNRLRNAAKKARAAGVSGDKVDAALSQGGSTDAVVSLLRELVQNTKKGIGASAP
jgi:hypothetical protein